MKLLEKLNREIARHDKPENRLNYQKFFKEKLEHPVSIKTAILRKISNNCFKEVKGKPAMEILDICDELLESGERYMRFFAFEWARKLKGQYRKADFARFERWLDDYVNHWGSCDSFCGITGQLLVQYPDLVTKVKKWTKSKNRWFRRAAAVSLVVPVRNGLLLKEVFKTADLLLTDDDDMVQKGYGWMLKEAGDRFPDEVFKYVMKNKREMPRTALRYAIEKYPAAKRKEAMRKD
ncbi:MAG: DNA alkylation repair protein [Candidatus Zixiibacteriota bacterium]|nr:MAG: DNA alkylation repair protein [candidate division Zixibacteria bacterium]